MEEGFEKNGTDREEIFSKSVRAGKRTYFFDVKATKSGDYYLTVTESKRRFESDGKFSYEKHKVFLYKEDFEKFMEALNESVSYITENSPEVAPRQPYSENTQQNEVPKTDSSFTDVNFEDLDK